MEVKTMSATKKEGVDETLDQNIIPRKLEVLRSLTLSKPLLQGEETFRSFANARIRLWECNELQSKIVKVQYTNKYTTKYICTNNDCHYKANIIYKQGSFLIKELSIHTCELGAFGDTKKFTNYSVQVMSSVIEPLLIHNVKMRNKDIGLNIAQYTRTNPTSMYLSRVKSTALKNIYGDPKDVVQKLPALVKVLNDQGHSCKLIFKNQKEMLNTLQQSANTALSYERKEKVKFSYFDVLMKEEGKIVKNLKSDDVASKVKTVDEYLTETIGASTLQDLRGDTTGIKYLYGIVFIPATSKRLALAQLMPNIWTGDGAHMHSMGTFLNFVFRDGNHNVHNAASMLVFDTECFDSWSVLMKFVVETYGKECFTKGDARFVADRDKGFDKSFELILTPLGVNRFCCSNHIGENIATRFRKNAKLIYSNAVKAPTKDVCDGFINDLPQKLKDSIGDEQKRQMFLSYTGDNTCGLTIHTNNNSEIFNSKHRNARLINVVSALNEIVRCDYESHQRWKMMLTKQLEDPNNTVTKGLKNTTWYKERFKDGTSLMDAQRITPLANLKANVRGAKGNYNVDLKNFKCDCNSFGCKHLFGTAQFYDVDIGSFFPKEYQLAHYRSQFKALGEYPPFPSTAKIAEHSNLFDNTLRIPIGGKRARGAPKKNVRKRSMKERAAKESKKRNAVMKR